MSDDLKPTARDMGHDLRGDLRYVNAYGMVTEGTRKGWSAAIRRALAAEFDNSLHLAILRSVCDRLGRPFESLDLPFDAADGLAASWVSRAEKSEARVEELETAIRDHRDQRGDDRCWLDDEKLYAALSEGYTPPKRDCGVELELCKKYIATRHNPATEYVSPQRRVEELEAALAAEREACAAKAEWLAGWHRAGKSAAANYQDRAEACEGVAAAIRARGEGGGG